MSAMMTNLAAIWEYYADRLMIFFFTLMIIYLMCNVKQLENAHSRSQSAVNVAVASPAMIPMQAMPAGPATRSPAERTCLIVAKIHLYYTETLRDE